jgi:hypothetical protein
MARVALVSGGTRGIGAAVSEALLKVGYCVAATYAGNDAAAKAFRAKTGAAVYRWDAGDFEACVAGVREVEAAVGAIDVLVNNAGIVRDSTLHKMTKAQWDAVTATDLNALFNMCRPVTLDGRRASRLSRNPIFGVFVLQGSGREVRFDNLNAICMQEPVLYVLGFAEPELRKLRRMCLICSFDLKRSLTDFRFISIISKNILQKPGDVPCHGGLLLFDDFNTVIKVVRHPCCGGAGGCEGRSAARRRSRARRRCGAGREPVRPFLA